MAGVDDAVPAVVVESWHGNAEPGAFIGAESRVVQRAAALGGKVELGASVGDVLADVFLGLPVVDGDVDVVDAGVQDGVEDCRRLIGRQWASHAGDHAAQFQGAEAQGGNVEPGAAEGTCG